MRRRLWRLRVKWFGLTRSEKAYLAIVARDIASLPLKVVRDVGAATTLHSFKRDIHTPPRS